PYAWHLMALFVFSLLATPLALLTPLPLKIAVDNINARPLPSFLINVLPASIARSDRNGLAMAAGLLVAVALLNQLRGFGASLMNAYTGERMLRDFRAKLFRHVQRLSLSYHDGKGTADSLYRIQYDATALQDIVVNGLVPFFSSAMTLIAMTYVTARINWKFALIGLPILPLLLLASHSYRRGLRSQYRTVKKLDSAALSVVRAAFGAVSRV